MGYPQRLGSRSFAWCVLIGFASGACSPRNAPDDADASAVDAPDASDATVVPPSLVAHFVTPAAGASITPLSIPFPSEMHMTADGTLADDLRDFSLVRVRRGGDALAAAYRGLDGFSRLAGAIFVIDTHGTTPPGLDATSLPARGADSLGPAATAFLVDLDASTPVANARVPVAAGWHPIDHALVVQPDGTMLEPGRRYAFVLTTGVRSDVAGVHLEASSDFAAIRDGAPATRATPLAMQYGEAIDRIVERAGSGFDRSTIAAVSVFRTMTRHRELIDAASAVRAGRVTPTPTLSTDATVAGPFHVARFGSTAHSGWNATLDEWLGTPMRVGGRDVPGFPDTAFEGTTYGLAHDAIGAVFTGTFVAPDYRHADDGEISFASDGAPIAVRVDQRLPVTFVLPRGPVPANGFPVVIWGHGLSNHRRHMLALANGLARRGIASVAIDFATFGMRADPTDTTTLEPGTYRGPDGIGDRLEYNAEAFFGHLTSIVQFRDNMRQTVLDLVQLRRLIGNASIDLSYIADEYAGIAPTFDTAHIGYAGDSLGGLIGTVFSAVAPDIDPVLLNVPGGGMFTTIAPDAPIIYASVGILPSASFGAPTGEPSDRFHPVMQLAQLAADPADPATFARFVTRPADGSRGHDVWMVESLWDEIISNRSTELLAREMGLAQLLPAATPIDGLASASGPLHANLPMGATGAYFQQAPSTHGANIAGRGGVRSYVIPFPSASEPRFQMVAHPYRIRQPIVAYQERIGEFFVSAFAGSTSISSTGIEPIDDMDDDGWTADEERTGGTDPFDPISHPSGSAPHPRDVGF